MKKIITKNNLIILSLIILFIVILNYENIKNFLYIKEGNEEVKTETVETIKAEIKEIADNMLSDADTGTDKKITFEEFLTDEIKGKIKKIFNLKKKIILLKNNFDSIDELIEKYKEVSMATPSNHKKDFIGNMDYTIIRLYRLKILKDLGIDFMEELESSSETDSSINLDTSNLF